MKITEISYRLYAGLVGGAYGLLQCHLLRLALHHPREPDMLLVYQALLCNALWLLLLAPSAIAAYRERVAAALV